MKAFSFNVTIAAETLDCLEEKTVSIDEVGG